LVAASTAAWLLLLDFSKKPLLADLEPSWMAALTYAASHGLQFGRDIVYTYGPLVHLVFSTFSWKLFVPDFVLELALKAIFVALVVSLALRLPSVRRWCFLAVILVTASISYQTLYLFGLAALGWLAIEPRQKDVPLLAAGFAFAAVVALIKFTFLWYGLLIVATSSAIAVAERRFARAALGAGIFVIVFCASWYGAGQQFSNLPQFVANGMQVTTGYTETMGLAARPRTLVSGVAVALLLLLQLSPIVAAKLELRTLAASGLFCAAAFLSWKLGFVRADAHTAEFFYFAAPASLAIAALSSDIRPKRFVVTNAALSLAVLLISGIAVVTELPTIRSAIADLPHRVISNLRVLRNPAAEAARLAESYRQYAAILELPETKKAVANARVDMFGYEQAVVIANGLNYTPNPTIQPYCSYTSRLSQMTSAFYDSASAPGFVLFKLQPIDNRVPTVENARLLLTLLRRFEPLLVERDYVLLRRRSDLASKAEAPLSEASQGSAKLGQPMTVPDGLIWCELQIHQRVLGHLMNFLYHPPEVQLELTFADGRTVRRRLPPALASGGFLVNPMPTYEIDCIGILTGKVPPSITTRSIKVLATAPALRSFKSKIEWRFSSIPPIRPQTDNAPKLYNQFRGFSDVFSIPATTVTSAMPLQRFAIDNRQFLLVHPTGEVRFKVPVGATAVSGEFAIHPEAYRSGRVDGVTFQIDYTVAGALNDSHTIFRKVLQPRRDPADQKVQQFRVELPPGPIGEIILRTLPPPSGSIDWAWSGWSNIHFAPTDKNEANPIGGK
jgi:hypothetical protein